MTQMNPKYTTGKMKEKVSSQNLSEIKKSLLMELISEDKKVTIYRPNWTVMVGRMQSAILLQQIFYRWNRERKFFYKFKTPCGHEKYRTGDSWIEELAFSVSEFDTALNVIATKITKGMSKKFVLEQKVAEFNDKGRMTNSQNLVVYWTDSNRITCYQLNEPLLEDALRQISEQNASSLEIQETEGMKHTEPLCKPNNLGYPDIDGHSVYSDDSEEGYFPEECDSDDYPVESESGFFQKHTENSFISNETENSAKEDTKKDGGENESASLSSSSDSDFFVDWDNFPKSNKGLMFDAVCFVCRFNPSNIRQRKAEKIQTVACDLSNWGRTHEMILGWSVHWYLTDFRGIKNSPPTPDQVMDDWERVLMRSDLSDNDFDESWLEHFSEGRDYVELWERYGRNLSIKHKERRNEG